MVMKKLIKRSIKIAAPAIAGGVVGAGIGLLLAPKSGKETRKDLKRFATTAQDRVNLAIDQGKELYEEGRKAVVNTIDAGKNFVEEKRKWLHA
jgi:gas vesicle protein